MGVVYKARQVKLNRIVALKMILSGEFAGSEAVQRFQSEAEAAANLDHPGIVPIYEIGEHAGQHYFSMGFIDGPSLQGKLSAGPMPAKEAAILCRKIAEAVAYAHSKNVIHRDLKPANVLIDGNGEPKVTDFGLAKKVEGDSGLTRTGAVMGTPSYMPPEQALGQTDKIGPAADIYSLGAILYCMITGRPPFQAANVVDTLKQVVDNEPVTPRTLDSKIPLDLETICLKCLEKITASRYASAQDLVDELIRFGKGEPIKARRIGRVNRATRWCKRNPVVTSFLALTSVMLLIVGASLRNESKQRKIAQEQGAIAQTQANHASSKSEALRRRNYNLQLSRAFNSLDESYDEVEAILTDQEACPPAMIDLSWRLIDALHQGQKPFDLQLPGASHDWTFSGDGTVLSLIADHMLVQLDLASGEIEETARPFADIRHEVPNHFIASSPTGDFIVQPKCRATTVRNPNATGPQVEMYGRRVPGKGPEYDSDPFLEMVSQNTPYWLCNFAEPLSSMFITEQEEDTDRTYLNNEPIAYSDRDSVRAASFSGDGKLLVTATRTSLQLWRFSEQNNLESSEYCELASQIPLPKFLTRIPNQIRFLPDQSAIVLGTDNDQFVQVSIDAGKNLADHQKLPWSGTLVSFSQDGAFALCCIEPGKKHVVYSTAKSPAEGMNTFESTKLLLIGFSGKPDHLLFLTKLGEVIQFSLKNRTEEKIVQLKSWPRSIRAAMLSRDGNAVAVETNDGQVLVWYTHDPTPRSAYQLKFRSPVSFTNDAKYLIAGTADGRLRFYDRALLSIDSASAPKASFDIKLPAGSATQIAISPSGSDAIVSNSHGDLFAFDVPMQKKSEVKFRKLNQLPIRRTPVNLSFVEDGKQASVTYVPRKNGNQFTQYWNIGSTEQPPVDSLSLHDSEEAVHLTRKDRSFYLHGRRAQKTDGEIMVAERTSGEIVKTFKAHEGSITDSRWTPDGKTLLTAGYDSTVRLWDVQTGDERIRLTRDRNGQADSRHGSRLRSWTHNIALAPNSTSLAVSYSDGLVRCWPARTDALFARRIGPVEHQYIQLRFDERGQLLKFDDCNPRPNKPFGFLDINSESSRESKSVGRSSSDRSESEDEYLSKKIFWSPTFNFGISIDAQSVIEFWYPNVLYPFARTEEHQFVFTSQSIHSIDAFKQAEPTFAPDGSCVAIWKSSDKREWLVYDAKAHHVGQVVVPAPVSPDDERPTNKVGAFALASGGKRMAFETLKSTSKRDYVYGSSPLESIWIAEFGPGKTAMNLELPKIHLQADSSKDRVNVDINHPYRLMGFLDNGESIGLMSYANRVLIWNWNTNDVKDFFLPPSKNALQVDPLTWSVCISPDGSKFAIHDSKNQVFLVSTQPLGQIERLGLCDDKQPSGALHRSFLSDRFVGAFRPDGKAFACVWGAVRQLRDTYATNIGKVTPEEVHSALEVYDLESVNSAPSFPPNDSTTLSIRPLSELDFPKQAKLRTVDPQFVVRDRSTKRTSAELLTRSLPDSMIRLGGIANLLSGGRTPSLEVQPEQSEVGEVVARIIDLSTGAAVVQLKDKEYLELRNRGSKRDGFSVHVDAALSSDQEFVVTGAYDFRYGRQSDMNPESDPALYDLNWPVVVWEAKTGKMLHQLGTTNFGVGLQFLGESHRVFVREPLKLRLFNANSGVLIRQWDDREYRGHSPDGSVIALSKVLSKPKSRHSVSRRRTFDFELVDAETGELLNCYRVSETMENVVNTPELPQKMVHFTGQSLLLLGTHPIPIPGSGGSLGGNGWRLTDLKTNKNISERRFQDNPIITSDGRFVVASDLFGIARVGSDGINWGSTDSEVLKEFGHTLNPEYLTITSVESNEEVGRVYVFNDGDWLVMDRDGRFDSSGDGVLANAGWLTGETVLPLSELTEQYAQEGLLASLLAKSDRQLRDCSRPEWNELEAWLAEAATKNEDRVQNLILVPNGHDDLLSLVDLGSIWTRGKWELKDGLLTAVEKGSVIEFPYSPPDEYRMTAIIEPLDKPSNIHLGQRLGGYRFLVTLGYKDQNSLERVDGKDVTNATTHQGSLLTQGKPAEVVVTVRIGSVQVAVDGKQIIDWKGEPSQLSLNHKTPHNEALMIHTGDCRHRIYRLSIEPLSGKGRVLAKETPKSDDVPSTDLTARKVPQAKSTMTYEKPVPLVANGDPITVETHAATRCFDWDSDGDLDLLVGGGDGRLWLYRNEAKGNVANFQRREPIWAGNKQSWGDKFTGVVLANLVGDALPDLVVGYSDNQVSIHRNIGTDQVPKFAEESTTFKVQDGCHGRVDVADWDGDGLQDLITGAYGGRLAWNRNQGTAETPVFSDGESFCDVNFAYNSLPRIIDFNQDGRLDLLLGVNWASVSVYLNDGTAEKPSVGKSQQTLWQDGSGLGIRELNGDDTTPELADLDGDGVLDLISGGHNGRLFFMKGIRKERVISDNAVDDLFGPPAAK